MKASGFFIIMENEIWKSVKGYEEYYEVSNKGRIKRLGCKIEKKGGNVMCFKPKNLKPYNSGNEYSNIRLSFKGKPKIKLLHRLVAEAFLPNPDNKSCVNHKNGNKKDNRVENLEWVTQSENHFHAYKTGLKKPTRGSKAGPSKLKEAEVIEIRELIKKRCKYDNIAKKYNISRHTVSDINRGETWFWL